MSFFDDAVVPLWLVIYDDSPQQTYVFSSPEKVLASVEGSVRVISSGVAAQSHIDRCTSEFISLLRNQMGRASFVPMQFDDLSITVVRIELDKHNPIFQLLSDCHAYIANEERRESIPWEERAAILDRIEDCFKRPL